MKEPEFLVKLTLTEILNDIYLNGNERVLYYQKLIRQEKLQLLE